MASVIRLSLLLALAGCDAFSPLQSPTSSHRRSSGRSTSAHRCSTSLGMSTQDEERGGDEDTIRRAGCRVDRRGYVGAVGAAVLTFAGAAAVQVTTPPALAVGKQPGSRTTAPPNALLLVPALRAKVATENLLKLLQDPAKWDEAREALRTSPLAPADFKECFRTYSDADPEQHLAFDLYRIQAQDALKAVSELLAYLASEKNKGSKIDREDVEDLDEAARSVLQGIDDFLKLAPSEDVLMAADQARAQAARPKRAAPTEATTAAAAAGRRELEGAVVGEGAFVAGAWVGEQ